MSQVAVRPFDSLDLEPVAALLASRQRRDRARIDLLSERLESPEPWMESLAAFVGSPDAVVAEHDGALVGFLAGRRMLLAPSSFDSQWVRPHSINIGNDAYALAEGEDSLAVFRAMYAELATAWVAAGFFFHEINIVAGDAELQEAWLTLGFGRALTAATRLTVTPVPARTPAGGAIRPATPADIDAVMALSDDLTRFHARAPMFWPILHDTDAAQRAFNLAALESGSPPYFLAVQDGEAVAMQTFLHPGFSPGIIGPEHNVYLFDGVVREGVRSSGLGSALLAHTMAWAHTAGYETCTLHFASANPSGGPFWLGHGFRPIEHAMQRHVDERIAWANR